MNRMGRLLTQAAPTGRAATGFGGFAKNQGSAASPEGSSAAGQGGSPAPTAAEVLPSPEQPSEAPAAAATAATSQPQAAADLPPADPQTPGASSPAREHPLPPSASAPVVPTEPTRSPAAVASALRRLLGDMDLASDERGKPTPLILDKNLDAYLHERVKLTKVEGGRATVSELIREALRTALPSEVARQGKAVLKARHERFGSLRTSVVIPPSLLEELRVEYGRYSSRANTLSVGALAELRVLNWASQQPDWTEGGPANGRS